MKRQVSQEAIYDLVQSSCKTSSRTLKIFQALKQYLPLIEDNCPEVAMDLALKELVRCNYFWPNATAGDIEAEKGLMRSIIKELENHLDKEVVLDAGIANLAQIELKIKRLKKLQQPVGKIFKNLDLRTKALFAVHKELLRLCSTTDLDYDEVMDVFDNVPIDCLKDDPSMLKLIEAYDLACDVTELLL